MEEPSKKKFGEFTKADHLNLCTQYVYTAVSQANYRTWIRFMLIKRCWLTWY